MKKILELVGQCPRQSMVGKPARLSIKNTLIDYIFLMMQNCLCRLPALYQDFESSFLRLYTEDNKVSSSISKHFRITQGSTFIIILKGIIEVNNCKNMYAHQNICILIYQIRISDKSPLDIYLQKAMRYGIYIFNFKMHKTSKFFSFISQLILIILHFLASGYLYNSCLLFY